MIAAWLVAAVALGPLQPRLQESTVNDPVVFLPSDAASTRVVELLGERFESGRTAPALVVYGNADGLTAEDEAAIGEDVEAFADVAGAQAVVSPLDEGAREAGLRSPDGTVAVAVVPLDRARSGYGPGAPVPATGHPLGRVAMAGPEDVDRAVAAARAALSAPYSCSKLRRREG